MKKFLLLVIIAVLNLNAFTQETFFVLLNENTVGSDVIENEEDYILIGSDSEAENLPANHLFQSFDSDGDSLNLWRHNNDSIVGRVIGDRIDNYTFGRSCNLLNEITYCYPNFTVYTDDFNDTLLYKNYRVDGISNFSDARWNSDSSFIVLGQGYSDSLNAHFSALIELDTMGNILWHQNYFGAFGTLFSPAGFIKADDGGFIINCAEINLDFQNFYQKTFFLKASSDGEEEFRVEIGDPEFYAVSLNLVKLSDGDLVTSYSNGYFAGSTVVNPDATTFIVKMDQELSILSEEAISTFGIDTTGTFLLALDGGLELENEFLFSGHQGDSALMFKFSNDLALQWQRFYRHPDQEVNEASDRTRINAIKQADDGGFLLPGVYYGQEGSVILDGEVAALVIKVDEFGCLEPGCELLDDIYENETFLSSLLLFPNPVDAKLNLHISDDYVNDLDLKIYSSLGQLLLYREGINAAQEIDVSQLEKGLYILQLIAREGQSRELKFIKN